MMDSVRLDGGWGVGALTVALVAASAGGGRAADLPALWAGPPASAPLPMAAAWDAAAPFHLVADTRSRDRAAACLASAIYYEAGGQSREGQEAVAQVVLNRVRHPAYPKSVCGVVYQGAAFQGGSGRGCQFTFACDGALGRAPDPLGWRAASEVAARALDGFVAESVGVSTHYHTLSVQPAWSSALTPTRRIGAHQFYRMPGALALSGVYAGAEPEVAPRLAAPGLQAAPGLRAATRASAIAFASLPVAAVSASATAQPSRFSVWGVQVAVVTPGRSGVVVSETPGS